MPLYTLKLEWIGESTDTMSEIVMELARRNAWEIAD